jgi:polysaccharide deacetylase 2 family uncharacterized protein YibQ
LRELGPAGGPEDRDPHLGDRRSSGVAWLVVVLLLFGALGWYLLSNETPPQPQSQVTLALPPLATGEATPPGKAGPSATVTIPAPGQPPSAVPPAPALPPAAQQQPAAPPASASAPSTAAAPPTAPPTPTGQANPPPQQAAAPTMPLPPPPPPRPEFKFKLAPEQLALAPVPQPDLSEVGPAGLLPRVAQDGRQSWQVYARPFDRADRKPRIAIVIGNLGVSGAATEAAIQLLPGTVTLAFSPYSPELDQDIPLARAAGHEVLLTLPMEPIAYPGVDPGPKALLTSVSAAQNLDRLEWLLGRFAGYVGVTDYIGSRLMASDADLRPVLLELHRRGLMFFDSRSVPNEVGGRLAKQLGLPTVENGHFIDYEASRESIDKALVAAEQEARRKGTSIALGFPYPVTIERVAAWARGLPAKGIELAPITAMVFDRRGS